MLNAAVGVSGDPPVGPRLGAVVEYGRVTSTRSARPSPSKSASTRESGYIVFAFLYVFVSMSGVGHTLRVWSAKGFVCPARSRVVKYARVAIGFVGGSFWSATWNRSVNPSPSRSALRPRRLSLLVSYQLGAPMNVGSGFAAWAIRPPSWR